MDKITAIILAGGKSSRFGCDKTLYPVDGKTMTERAADILRPFVDEILISVDRKGKFFLPETKEVEDVYSDIGPIGGIYSGLLSAKHEKCIIVAGDIIQIDKGLTLKLLAFSEGFRAVVPVNNGKLEPLYAVYSKKMLPDIEKKIHSGEYSLWKFLLEEKGKNRVFLYSVRDEREKRFFDNINIPEDMYKVDKSLLNN